jgi:outer membrane lipoprotein-sorting protein
LRFTITGLGLCALPLAGGPAPAQAALNPEEEQAVHKAERYLNRITTLRSRFVQISSNGAYAEGEVVVRRPGRLRFEYDPPHPVLLIADGTNLLYYDKELKQASFIPLWETPLWFLIRKKVELSDNVEVTQISRATGTLRMTLQETGGGDAGAVTLVFSDRPFALR